MNTVESPMPQPDETLEGLLKQFLEDDQRRKKDPMFGIRRGEQTLFQLCEFWKKNEPSLSGETKERVRGTLLGMNLVPYRSYCREHLLDIGITNV